MANIEHINVLKAPIAKVYEALTTEEGLAAVWTSELKVKPELGFINEFSFGAETDRFEIKALVPNQRVLWYCIDSDPQWIGTSVSFDLEEKRGKNLRHPKADRLGRDNGVLQALQLQLGLFPIQSSTLL
jgi:uncharacterized protein YndB with AHSA1/START domain